MPSSSLIFNAIKQRRAKYPEQFDNFDALIWNHFERNAQVSTSISTLLICFFSLDY